MGKFFPTLLAISALFVCGIFLLPSSTHAYDNRALKLTKFLQAHNSPLSGYAQVFVEQADKNDLDYRLLPAIAGVESTFAKSYVQGSYNAYGWGGGKIYFQSWDEGIAKISEGLKIKYVDRGAESVEEISWIYCPPGNLHWAAKVRYFMNQIQETEVEIASNYLASALPLTL